MSLESLLQGKTEELSSTSVVGDTGYKNSGILESHAA